MNNNESIDVSVVIVNYNTKDITLACIDSIIKYTHGISYEIILLDNASTDGSKELFEKDERIIYVYNTANYGFGKANNIGASIAAGKYLFFLNSDTYLQNNAINIFFNYAEKCNSSTAFWGSVLLDKEGKPNGSNGKFPTLRNSLAQASHINCSRELRPLEPFQSFKVDYVLGADLFVRKNVFDELNGFDEDFFMYYEESDLQRRGAYNGFEAMIISGPQIVHLEGQSTDHVSHMKRMMVERSHLLHLSKHYSKTKYKSFLAIYLLLKIPVFINGHFTFKENIAYLGLLTKNLFN